MVMDTVRLSLVKNEKQLALKIARDNGRRKEEKLWKEGVFIFKIQASSVIV